MKTLILAMLLAVSAHAQEMPLKVRNLYIETERHMFSNRTPYIPEGEELQYSLNLGLDIDVTDSIYSKHLVTSYVTESQFRHVGYDSEIGYKTKWGIDIYLRHFSGHALDFTYENDFPENNSIGLRFNLLRY